jgi:large subunit ribosomal protein L25
MSTRPTLAATTRAVFGKRVSQLRRDGQLPAVVFGHGVPSEPVSVSAHEFDLLRRSAGPNAIIDLKLDGHKARPVLIHGVQSHPVTRRPLHADLFLVTMTEELTVDVQLVSVGVAPAVDLQGGTLLHAMESVKVRALPDHLPQSIEYSVESLADFDAIIHVGDLPIPEGVTLLTDPGEVVAKVLRARVEIPEVAEVAEVEPGIEAGEGGETAAEASSPQTAPASEG